MSVCCCSSYALGLLTGMANWFVSCDSLPHIATRLVLLGVLEELANIVTSDDARLLSVSRVREVEVGNCWGGGTYGDDGKSSFGHDAGL